MKEFDEARKLARQVMIFGIVSGILLLIAITMFAFGGEVEEVQRIAPKYNAKVEVPLWDDTRVDILSEEYAIEVDWAEKWAEGIGQALYYAEVTKKKPGVVLLIKNRKAEARYIYRLQTVAAKHDIKFWIEEVEIR